MHSPKARGGVNENGNSTMHACKSAASSRSSGAQIHREDATYQATYTTATIAEAIMHETRWGAMSLESRRGHGHEGSGIRVCFRCSRTHAYRGVTSDGSLRVKITIPRHPRMRHRMLKSSALWLRSGHSHGLEPQARTFEFSRKPGVDLFPDRNVASCGITEIPSYSEDRFSRHLSLSRSLPQAS